MNNNTYGFNIGSFRCLAVSDGVMTYAPPTFPPPPDFLFANADRKELSRLLGEMGIDIAAWHQWTSSYNCLFVDTGKHKVLIDTGAGSLGPNTGKLVPNLASAGVSPEDIDLVVLTHGHPDHIGGNLDAEGKPVFPRARWVMCQDEWSFWTSDQAEQQLDKRSGNILINIARSKLLPLKGKIDLLREEDDILPGIRPVFTPGHTPGLMALSITSEGQRLLCLSDAVLHPLHITQPAWHAATDVFPDQVVAGRWKLLSRAALENSLVMAFHFPFPGLGYIRRVNEGWRWQESLIND